MATFPLSLVVVIPVFNEHEAIESVLIEWRAELSQRVQAYRLLVINDGSTDATLEKLRALTWPELVIHTHSNRGHGQSCLAGYRMAADMGAEYVFQIDSDGQCEPSAFRAVWEQRGKTGAVYGRRTTRADGWSRWLVTRVLRWLLKLLLRTGLNDTNVPYRLYSASVAAEASASVSPAFELANIAMALVMEPKGFIEVPIHFRDRIGGHPSVKWFGFAKKAVRLLRDLKTLKK